MFVFRAAYEEFDGVVCAVACRPCAVAVSSMDVGAVRMSVFTPLACRRLRMLRRFVVCFFQCISVFAL